MIFFSEARYCLNPGIRLDNFERDPRAWKIFLERRLQKKAKLKSYHNCYPNGWPQPFFPWDTKLCDRGFNGSVHVNGSKKIKTDIYSFSTSGCLRQKNSKPKNDKCTIKHISSLALLQVLVRACYQDRALDSAQFIWNSFVMIDTVWKREVPVRQYTISLEWERAKRGRKLKAIVFADSKCYPNEWSWLFFPWG